MSTKRAVETSQAPAAIGCYSQAICIDQMVYISGQLGLQPDSGNLCDTAEQQVEQVFLNLQAIAKAAGADLSDALKLTVYLTDMDVFPQVNRVMSQFFQPPYPARAAVCVAALPKGAVIEVDAILYRADI